MASHHQEASSSNSSNSNSTQIRTYKHDIFLSFRGDDTRKNFTGHLYHALNRKGFKVFRDDEDLERGEVISDKLLQGIKESNFAIVVLSKNYADSSWCLDELRHIVLDKINDDQKVFPIFYGVDPSDVRHKRGSFAEAFAKHQENGKEDKVMESWKDCLTKVANLSGWDSKHWHEAELIDTVVEDLWTKLHSRQSPCNEEHIGIVDKIAKLDPLLGMGSNNDVRFVGIWGLPGVGKTTIARAILDKYSNQFHISCFLPIDRENPLERDGEVHLQRKLLQRLKIAGMEIEDTHQGKKIIQNCFRNKKVLLVLDDVSESSHLDNFANSRDWFGAGSRVIITTRNLGLLRGADHVHEVQIMDQEDSLELFCQKAFGRGEICEDLLEMSKAVCEYAGGIALALSTLGSYFRQRNSNVAEWEDVLDMLKKNPHQRIFTALKISFDALTKEQKAIFLDIACFFNGWSKNDIIQMLESCGFHAKTGIKMLHEMSLLKEYDSFLVMHDLLRQMGREIIVAKYSVDVGSGSRLLSKEDIDVGSRSRLWSKEDIDEVMENNLGTKEIEGMVSSTCCEACFWHPEAFAPLHGLRLLIISSSDSNHPHPGLQCLSHALKVLHWTKYPFDTLPSKTRLLKLVDLRMHHSKLKKLWDKNLCSEKLKFLDLSYSKNLIETPDFSELPNLERLELEGCTDLVDLHASIGQHKKLQVLNLKGCINLKGHSLKKLEMTGLKEFVLCGCIQVKYLPEFGESMKNLKMLDAGETNLVKLPESIGLLSGLETLKLRGCKTLICLPQSILKLKHLVFIDIGGCSKLDRLPEKLNEMEALEEIDASETDITEIPASIGGLKNIKKISFGGCKRSKFRGLMPLLNHLFQGHSILHKGLTIPASLFSLESLKELNLSYCGINDESISIDDFNGLPSLETLDMSGNMFKNPPVTSFSKLPNLQYLFLNSCPELQSLPQPPPSLTEMDAGECGSLEPITLLHLFASSIGQEEMMVRRIQMIFSVTVPGIEIPSWFGNQNDLCLNEYGVAEMMIDIPPCQEMLGIGLCILVDHKLYSTGVNKMQLRWPGWVFRFAEITAPRGEDGLVPCFVPTASRSCRKEIKSSHLWIVFWRYSGKESDLLQLWKHNKIPLQLQGDKAHAKVLIKCGWRVICKSDFDDQGRSQDLLTGGANLHHSLKVEKKKKSIHISIMECATIDFFGCLFFETVTTLFHYQSLQRRRSRYILLNCH